MGLGGLLKCEDMHGSVKCYGVRIEGRQGHGGGDTAFREYHLTLI